MLILMSGPPGVGKSTLTRALSKNFNFVWLDKDLIDEPFSPNERGLHYSEQIEPKVLEALLNLSERNLSIGHAVLLDLPWTHILLNSPQWQDAIQKLISKMKVPLLVLEMVLPEAELRDRLQSRGLMRDKVKLTEEGWKAFRQSDRLGESNPFPCVQLDARKPTSDLVTDLFARCGEILKPIARTSDS